MEQEQQQQQQWQWEGLFDSQEEARQGLAAASKVSFAFAESMAAKAALLLKVPDIIAAAGGSPMSVTEIAEKIPTETPPEGLDVLRRIMRFLGASGFFTVQAVDGEEETRYGNSAVAKCFLQSERPGFMSVAPYLLLENDEVAMAPWHHFNECVTGGGQAFVRAHGTDMWHHSAKDKRFNTLFNAAMACGAQMLIRSLLSSSYRGFREVSSLVDIGGGTGASAEAIVKHHPNIKSAINFDLPHVIADAPKRQGVEHVAGDMFEKVPSAECIMLKTVLHDWTDEVSVKVLKVCRAALPKNGRVVLVEHVLPGDGESFEDEEQKGFAMEVLTLDLVMIAHTPGGRERNASDWRAILSSAGFSKVNIVPLRGRFSAIEAFP